MILEDTVVNTVRDGETGKLAPHCHLMGWLKTNSQSESEWQEDVWLEVKVSQTGSSNLKSRRSCSETKRPQGFVRLREKVRRSFSNGEKSQSQEALRGRGCRQELLSMNATSF